MIKELSESLRYVNHYFAICFLRIAVGVFIFRQALEKIYGEYLQEPVLAGMIAQWEIKNDIPPFVEILFDYIRNYWVTVAHFQAFFELAAGLLLIIGFCVRPTILLLIAYYWFFSYIEPYSSWKFIHLFLLTLFTIGWSGAGRCLGIDYYFYKRRRGFLW